MANYSTTQSQQLSYVECLGNFANARYKGIRMPPIEWEQDLSIRRSMYQQWPIKVYNARELRTPPSLEQNGFSLVSHETTVRDLHDQNLVGTVFYQECADVVRKITGCREVKVTQHQYRNGFGGLPEGHVRRHRPTANDSEGSYAGIHSDVTPWSEPDWKTLANGNHFQVYNLWRSTDLAKPIQVMPLSLCDTSTVAPEDMIHADSWGQSAARRRLVSYRLAYNEKQRWYYFPLMQPNELLIFKQYDTMQDAPNMRATYHGSVNDPNVGKDAPLRESVEVRLMALFDRDEDREARVRRFQSEIPKENPDGNVSTWQVEQ